MKYNGQNEGTTLNFFVFQLTINPQPLDTSASGGANPDENKPGEKVFFLFLGRNYGGGNNQYVI